MMLQSIDKNIKLFFYLLLFFLLTTQITINKSHNKRFTIKLNKIVVTGLSDENNYEIYQSLKYLLEKNIFFINKNNFESIMEKNELVENYNIKKIYPSIIKIKIKQTNLLAITNYNSNKFYIGSNGKLISFNKIKNFNSYLPFVYTKSNYIDFIKFKKIIDESDFQFDQIESFYYFPSNRWDIKTKDGFLIKLPEKNLSQSLKLAQLVKDNENTKKKNIIDLRIINKIILSNE